MSTQVRETVAAIATDRPAAERDRAPQLLCAWFGPAATVLAFLGLVVVAGFIPAQHPSASAGTIMRFYEHNTTGIRIGMMLAMIGFTFFIPFGIAIAVQTRRIENRRPVMTYIQIACVAIGSLEGVMTAFIFATAAFRPGHMSAQITRTLNDLGWFAFLFDVPPFMIWIGAIGYVILRDQRATPVFPRWVGYFNLWVALLIFPADLMAFFKHGPFGYNGIFALYLPAGLFFAWILTMTPFLIKAIKRDTEAEQPVVS
jgi:hypothetical protein